MCFKQFQVNIDYGFDCYANPIEVRQKRAMSQYFFNCSCVACANNWPNYSAIANKPRSIKVKLTPPLIEELERQAANYTIGMDFLLKLDIPTAIPIFRDYLMVMNAIVVHPDARYIDCEEAYKQCLWLENRGYKPKVTSPGVVVHQGSHDSASAGGAAMGRQISASSTMSR